MEPPASSQVVLMKEFLEGVVSEGIFHQDNRMEVGNNGVFQEENFGFNLGPQLHIQRGAEARRV